jgi:hypothetical protein
VATTDHKKVGLLYLFTTVFFFMLGGVEALLMRIQLGSADSTFLDPTTYNQLFTMHGTTMIFLVVVPIWAGGGTIFGPQPRDYSYRLPRTARRKALLSALSLKRHDGKLIVVDKFEPEQPKTKIMAKALADLNDQSALIVIAQRRTGALVGSGTKPIAARRPCSAARGRGAALLAQEGGVGRLAREGEGDAGGSRVLISPQSSRPASL